MAGLRIAYVKGAPSPKYGAFERFILSVARECAARGHRFFAVWLAPPASEAFARVLSPCKKSKGPEECR